MNIKAFLFAALPFIISCAEHTTHSNQFEITEAKGFPRWLKDKNYSTYQTSGIAFIGRDENNLKTFLAADDIGKIHHLKIKDDTLLYLSPVNFSKEAEIFLDSFPKADFEDITYDKSSNAVFVSIEGNLPDPKKYTCICRINFENEDPFSDKIVSFRRLNFKPGNLFFKYVDNNMGYEGLAVDSNYFYLGLEGIKKNNLFADSTLILIAGKKDLKIKKLINARNFGIQSICGLYSQNDKNIIGVDRNKRKIFRIIFNDDLTVKRAFSKDVDTKIPSFPAISYVASLESVSMDDQSCIYLVDDPWKQFFIPSNQILRKIDSTAVKNFTDFVPVIYKFKLESDDKLSDRGE